MIYIDHQLYPISLLPEYLKIQDNVDFWKQWSVSVLGNQVKVSDINYGTATNTQNNFLLNSDNHTIYFNQTILPHHSYTPLRDYLQKEVEGSVLLERSNKDGDILYQIGPRDNSNLYIAFQRQNIRYSTPLTDTSGQAIELFDGSVNEIKLTGNLIEKKLRAVIN